MSKQRINDMTNAIQTWMSDVRGAEYGFLSAVVFALDEFDKKNNLPLYALISICNGKPFSTYKIIKGDRLTYAAPLKRILDETLSGIKIVFKNDKYSVRAETQGGINADKMTALRNLAEAKTRVQSDAFKAEFPVIKKDDLRSKAEKVNAFKARAQKFAKEHDIDLTTLAAAITAKNDAFEPAH